MHRFLIKVRSYECDAYNHVNHSVYLNYLEAARVQMLEDAGISFAGLTEAGMFLVIAEIQAHYLRSALMGETLEIITKVVEAGSAFGVLEQTILKEDREVLKAKIKFVCTNPQGRPQRMTGPLKNLFMPA